MSKFIELTAKNDNDGTYYSISVNVNNILYMHSIKSFTRIVFYGDTWRGVKESVAEIKKKIAESKELD